ncbi:hypothetical protein BDR07DRAFT_1486445 [Suillus spraguei]|nr:hypothetical protein BDR07DRAFT_1486445 [Suillus spraguei]
MPEVFTAQLKETSRHKEEQRHRHTDEIEAQNRARYHIVVYSLIKDGGHPNIFEFQLGTSSFAWPHLSLNHQVISLMGLATAGLDEGVGAASIIHVWNHQRREWRGVRPRYLVTVVEGRPVLLKNPNVTQCVDLDTCIRSADDSPPNLHSHLAADRSISTSFIDHLAAVIIFEHSFYIFDKQRYLPDEQKSVPSFNVALERYIASPHAAAVRKAVRVAIHGNSFTWKAKLLGRFHKKGTRSVGDSHELARRIVEITLEHRLSRPGDATT